MQPFCSISVLRLSVILALLFSPRHALLAAETNLDSPPPAFVTISFDRDIRPLLEESCLRCHSGVKPRSHFRLDDRQAALAGGDDNTNDLVPGDSRDSQLIRYVAGQVPELEMPPIGRGHPLNLQQIGLLRAWIDQGLVWSVTNPPPVSSFAFAPAFRQVAVQGNQAKFRELQGIPAGSAGGIEGFSAAEQISPDERVSLTGHMIVPDRNLALQLDLDKYEVGFIHAGFDAWRKYYAPDGGYDPAVFPSGYNPDQNLYLDNGRAWVDFGLDQPRWPQMVLGYEYRFRSGNEPTLDWGYASGKNIYPASQSVDERTHTFKLDLSHDFADWQAQDNARISFYRQNNQGTEPNIFLGGTVPDTFILTRDNYRQVQGMNTLVVSRQIRDWWFTSAGFYYSYLSGNDYFNQTTAIPAQNFNNALSSGPILLSRQSEIFSVANLFTSMDGVALSLGSQNEWTDENGFGESIPDLEIGGAVPAGSSLGELKASQTANLRYTRLPFSILFGDAQFSEDNYNLGQAQDATELQRETAANALRYDLKAGFSTSPWSWGDWTTQFERQASLTDYHQLTDLWQGVSGASNGYPGFLLNRETISDSVATRLVLRPARWLKTTLSYQLDFTDYSSTTDPTFVSAGGFVADGYSDSQTYSVGATLTPWRPMFFNAAFNYSRSRTVTTYNGDPSLVPYEGDVVTLITSANYALNLKTSLQLAYHLSRSNYAENNAVAGIPAGLDYLRQDVVLSLARKLTKQWTGVVRYEFTQYNDPGAGNLYNFTANAIFASLVFQWP